MSEVLLRDALHVWHPFTPTPSVGPRELFVRGQGAYLYDNQGKAYFDATSSWWTNIHGHCHPRLVEALRRQASTLDQFLFAPHTHEPAVALASELLGRLGQPFSKVFFSDDGSTAVEASLKIALQYWQQSGRPEKREFLGLELGYHGDTIGAVSVSHTDDFHGPFAGSGFQVSRLTSAYCYRCPVGLTYPNCKIECLKSTRELIEKEHQKMAALIVEPLVLGAGGMVIYPFEFLRELVALCKAHDILVIFDEVFTGFGRTGTFFVQDSLPQDLRPDLICLSKGLTAGVLPMSVVVTTSEIFSAFSGGAARAFYHGHTFSGNPLGCAVALESLKLFEEGNLIKNNEKLSAIMVEAAQKFRSIPHVGEVRHKGMIWAMELVADRRTKAVFEPAKGPGWKIASALWKQGIWVRPLRQVLYVVPPYCTTESELRDLFAVLYSETTKEAHFTAGML